MAAPGGSISNGSGGGVRGNPGGNIFSFTNHFGGFEGSSYCHGCLKLSNAFMGTAGLFFISARPGRFLVADIPFVRSHDATRNMSVATRVHGFRPRPFRGLRSGLLDDSGSLAMLVGG